MLLRFLQAPILVLLLAVASAAQPMAEVAIRSKDFSLHIYGEKSGAPLIVSSGDGGWCTSSPKWKYDFSFRSPGATMRSR